MSILFNTLIIQLKPTDLIPPRHNHPSLPLLQLLLQLTDGVPPSPQHQRGQPEALHVLHAGPVALQCEVEAAQPVPGEGVRAAL